MKLVDETITAFPRVWSRSDDGVSAQLHEEDHLKPEPGKNTIVSYPSNSFRQVRAVLSPARGPYGCSTSMLAPAFALNFIADTGVRICASRM